MGCTEHLEGAKKAEAVHASVDLVSCPTDISEVLLFDQWRGFQEQSEIVYMSIVTMSIEMVGCGVNRVRSEAGYRSG